jgi:hypothetical protein
MNRIPHEAMAAFCEGEDEERQRPEHNTPTARAKRAIGASPFVRAHGPFALHIDGTTYAGFATERGVVLTPHVKPTRTPSDALLRCAGAMVRAERHPVDLAMLRAWCNCFDGPVDVRVFGVPVNAEQLFRTFEAFPTATEGAYAVATVEAGLPGEEPSNASMICLVSDGIVVGVTQLASAKDCAAAWPIPAGVRE